MLAPLIFMANGAVAVPQAPSIHDGTGAHRGAGVPRKRRRRVDPEFTLEKPKKPVIPTEPEIVVATMEAAVAPEVEGAEPTPAPELEIRPLTRKIKRLKQGTPAVAPVVDTLAVDMLLAEVAQRVRDEQEEDEAIIAFLLSHL